MLEAFILPFFTIALAEVGDKTQLLLVAFAAKHSSLTSFLGAIMGFTLIDGISVLAGATVLALVPVLIVKLLAATVFFFLGLITLITKEKEEKVKIPKSAFLTAFSLVALSELGDKSQIAAILFAGQYNAWIVLLGVLSAMAVMTLSSFVIGRTAGKMIRAHIIRKISGFIFIGVAITTFISVL
jgi:putative Ca2+/H+ antiporter (TMEM165/GDT1 family)